MLFFIKKMAGMLFMPPATNIIFIMVGISCLSIFRKIGVFFITVGTVTLWLFSAPIVAKFLIAPLQNKYSALKISALKVEQRTAIVVLEADLNMTTPEYDNKPLVSDATLTRLRYAAFLHYKTHAPILVSGNNPYHPDVSQTHYMAATLKAEFHVPTQWQENKGYDTDKEAFFAIPILKKAGIKKIYLVTHAFHMPRSVYVFQNKGIRIIPAPTGYENISTTLHWMNFFPSAIALRNSTIALHEYFGLLWYKICSLFNIKQKVYRF